MYWWIFCHRAYVTIPMKLFSFNKFLWQFAMCKLTKNEFQSNWNKLHQMSQRKWDKQMRFDFFSALIWLVVLIKYEKIKIKNNKRKKYMKNVLLHQRWVKSRFRSPPESLKPVNPRRKEKKKNARKREEEEKKYQTKLIWRPWIYHFVAPATITIFREYDKRISNLLWSLWYFA